MNYAFDIIQVVSNFEDKIIMSPWALRLKPTWILTCTVQVWRKAFLRQAPVTLCAAGRKPHLRAYAVAY